MSKLTRRDLYDGLATLRHAGWRRTRTWDGEYTWSRGKESISTVNGGWGWQLTYWPGPPIVPTWLTIHMSLINTIGLASLRRLLAAAGIINPPADFPAESARNHAALTEVITGLRDERDEACKRANEAARLSAAERDRVQDLSTTIAALREDLHEADMRSSTLEGWAVEVCQRHEISLDREDLFAAIRRHLDNVTAEHDRASATSEEAEKPAVPPRPTRRILRTGGSMPSMADEALVDRIADEVTRHMDVLRRVDSDTYELRCLCGGLSVSLTGAELGTDGANLAWRRHRAAAILGVMSC